MAVEAVQRPLVVGVQMADEEGGPTKLLLGLAGQKGPRNGLVS